MEEKLLTKQLIAQALKALMPQREFSRITIKNITDRAGIIRPTFYRHFRDKCDVLEYIACTQLLEKADILADGGMAREALLYLLHVLWEERDFYRKAFQVTGQNGFSEALCALMEERLYHRLTRPQASGGEGALPVRPRLAAKKYAADLVFTLQMWVESPEEPSAEEYTWLMTHALQELLE